MDGVALDCKGGTEPDRRQKRRAAIVASARSLFLERGYDAVSLGEIVRHSGGSLSTLYTLFDNKEGLLRAIVAEEQFEGIERLDAIIARGDPPAVTLRAIAESIEQAIGHSAVIKLMRVVMAKSLDDAAFACAVYRNAHLPRLGWLTRLFTRWASEGLARIPDPALAAHFFLGLTLHGAQNRALFGDPDDAAAIDPQRCVAGAVDLFVAGYAVAPRDTGVGA